MAKKVLKQKSKGKQARKARAQKHNDDVTVVINHAEESNQHMQDLLKALTDLAKEATIFLAKKNGTLSEKVAAAVAVAETPVPVKDPPATAAAAEVAEPKTRGRGRAKTAEAAAPADLMESLGLPPSTEKPAPAEKPLTDEESYKLLMQTATEYVTHFGKEKGVPKAKAHLKPYKNDEGADLDKITDLKHEQRLPYIKALKAELAAAKA